MNDECVCGIEDDYEGVPWGSDDYSGTVERRERIVRCRDCMHSRRDGWECWRLVDDPENDFERVACVQPDGFCAWGMERGAV